MYKMKSKQSWLFSLLFTLTYKIHVKHTCCMSCMKSFSLNWSIWIKHHIQSISRWRNWRGNFGPAESSQASCFRIITVKYGYMVVCAFLMLLQLKVLENNFDSLTIYCCEMPDTVFPTRIKVGPVWTTDLTRGCVYFMLATTWRLFCKRS